jgi:hypothetical protein
MTKLQPPQLTEAERAEIQKLAARYPPFKPDQARRLAAMFLPKPRATEAKKSA